MGEENEVAVNKKDETSAKKLVYCKLCRNHKQESIVKLHKEVCEFRDCECKACIITKKDRLRARDSTRRRRSITNAVRREHMEKAKANSAQATTPIKPIEPKERLATAKTKKIRKELTTSKSLPPVPLPKICADQPQRMDVTLETTVGQSSMDANPSSLQLFSPSSSERTTGENVRARRHRVPLGDVLSSADVTNSSACILQSSFGLHTVHGKVSIRKIHSATTRAQKRSFAALTLKFMSLPTLPSLPLPSKIPGQSLPVILCHLPKVKLRLNRLLHL